MRPSFANAIDRAVGFLRDKQRESGEFTVYANQKSARMEGENRAVSTPFGTTFTIDALRCVEHPDAKGMIDKACRYLLDAMAPDGSWFYNPDGTLVKLYGTQFADADDTACCAQALLSTGHTLPEPSKTNQILLEHRDPNGLFLTWLDHGMRTTGNDLDSIVNANVVYYLGDTPDTAPVIDYLNDLIERGAEHDSYLYYLDDLMLYYCVSRAMHHGMERVARLAKSKPAMIERTLRRRDPDGAFGSDLHTALAAATLIHCDRRSEAASAIDALVKRQAPDGSWTSEGLYGARKPPQPGIFVFWCGSAELTTTFCLEAIARFGRGE